MEGPVASSFHAMLSTMLTNVQAVSISSPFVGRAQRFPQQHFGLGVDLLKCCPLRFFKSPSWCARLTSPLYRRTLCLWAQRLCITSSAVIVFLSRCLANNGAEDKETGLEKERGKNETKKDKKNELMWIKVGWTLPYRLLLSHSLVSCRRCSLLFANDSQRVL